MKNKRTMYMLMLGYGIVEAVVITCICGLRNDTYLGVLLGIGSLMVNYWLLAYVVEGIIKNKLTFSVLPLGLSRFIIFGVAGWICFKQSHLCVVMFGISILAMPVAALMDTLWEVKDDQH